MPPTCRARGVVDSPDAASRPDCDIHPVLGHVYPHVGRLMFHMQLPCPIGPALRDTGSVGPGNRSGSAGHECDDPRFSSACYDQCPFGLAALGTVPITGLSPISQDTMPATASWKRWWICAASSACGVL